MQLETFYSALLPSEGSFALFEKASKRHVWANSHAELIELTRKCALTSPDWYFATAAFQPDADGEYSRVQTSVSGKKCFYADIDAGPEKYAKHGDSVYPTLRDAFLAVVDFAKTTGLQPSLLVRSGGGLHAYWALDDTLAEWEWAGDAARLKKVMKAHGLRADHACTADSARLLRPVGALHGNGKTVEVLKDTGKRWGIDEWRAKVTAIVGNDVELSAPPAYLRDVSGDVTPAFNNVPTNYTDVVKRCPALKAASVQNGKNASEPMWRAVISIVKTAEDGRTLIHRVSSGHPGYSPEDTDVKYERYSAGPMTCDTISDYTNLCVSCEHRGKITSPVSLGSRRKEPAPIPSPGAVSQLPQQAIDEKLMPPGRLPEGFELSYEDGKFPSLRRRVRVPVDKEAAKPKEWTEELHPFTQDLFWFDGWMDNDGTQGTEYTLFIRRHSKSITQAHTLAGGSLSSLNEALKTLADKGIRPDWRHEDSVKNMSKYVEAQLARIKRESSRPVVRNHYGFRMEAVDGEMEMSCAHGPYMIRKDGSIRKALVSSPLMAAGAQFGIAKLVDNEDQEWKPSVWSEIIHPSAVEQAEFYRTYHTKGHELLQLVIALHMASPFLLFAAENDWGGGPLPANGFTVSLYSSRSGVGKSAAMKAAASAWGNANTLVPAGSKYDMTQNAMVARIASHGTMAFAADEVTQNGPAETANLINVVAGGQTKHRATKTGGVSGNQSTWSLISIISSNTRQREMLAIAQSQSNALQMRMIELDCDQLRRVNAKTSQAYEEARNAKLHANYGALGAMLNFHCVKLGYPEMRRRGQIALAAAREILPNAMEGRFFCRALAAVFMLQDALEELGLSIFETEALQNQFHEAYTSSLTSAKQMTLTSVDRVREYIRSNIRSILTTDNMRGQQSTMRDRLLGVTPIEVIGRNVVATGVTYLAVRPFNKWCVAEGASAITIINELHAEGRLQVTEKNGKDTLLHQINITQGLDMVPVVQDCLVIKADLGVFAKGSGNVTQLKTENDNVERDFTGAGTGQGEGRGAA